MVIMLPREESRINIHKNARLRPDRRAQLITHVLTDGESIPRRGPVRRARPRHGRGHERDSALRIAIAGRVRCQSLPPVPEWRWVDAFKVLTLKAVSFGISIA